MSPRDRMGRVMVIGLALCLVVALIGGDWKTALIASAGAALWVRR